MSAPRPWSGRRSDRVESPAPNSEVRAGEPAATAPGSTVPVRLSGSAECRPPRVGPRQLLRLDRDLSDRERAVLGSLAACRFLTTGQLQRLHFADHATEGAASRICRRVLARLGRLGVIGHLERRIGGIRAGSASYVWRVGPVGDRLLRQASDGARARRKEPSPRYLDHCLAVADCYLVLVEAARGGRLELLSYQPEPACWRSYMGPHGGPEILKPDLYAVTAGGEFEDSWFIEVDRSTESLPALLKKCRHQEVPPVRALLAERPRTGRARRLPGGAVGRPGRAAGAGAHPQHPPSLRRRPGAVPGDDRGRLYECHRRWRRLN
jgi:Replication-relaxation